MPSSFGSWVEGSDKRSSKSMRDTKASLAFKTSGRNSQINWANRFSRDFNDLQYNVRYDLVKGKADFSPRKNKERNQIKQKITKNNKEKNRLLMMKMNQSKNNKADKYSIQQEKKYSTLDSQGLCKFQFQKTIKGKMAHRSNRHMSFQYQTERSKNLNQVWYNPENQLTLEKMFKNLNKSKIKKLHGFSSYTPRRVFQPREELDKFYETKDSHELTTPRTIRETVEMEKVTGRREGRQKMTTELCYEQYDAREKIMRKGESYEINKAERPFYFNRQVISSRRGCYR